VIVSVLDEGTSHAAYAVHDVIAKPLDGESLVAALERARVLADREGGVLVIDDDPISRKLLDVTLTQLGYTTIARENAEAGLEAVRALSPSAIVLDLLMPGMDGFEFLARLRAMPEHANTPVLVWSVKHLSSTERDYLRSTLHAGIGKSKSGGGNLLGELRTFMQASAPSERGA
jgi:CheY-like chemotaxis protein